jgi:hypothetical protein
LTARVTDARTTLAEPVGRAVIDDDHFQLDARLRAGSSARPAST